jgi:site-specific recombinase XerD
VEKRLEKPSKPLGFSKTVVTRYLAPEGPPPRRSKPVSGAHAGRPTSRLLTRVDADEDDLAPVVALSGSSRNTAAPAIAPLVREWLAEVKVMGRSEQTITWYRQKMEYCLEREGGPATLDGLTSTEIKRLLASLMDRQLAPNTIHGFFEVVRAFANWALREGFPVDPAVVRMRPPKVPETELETCNPTQQEAMLSAAAPGWPSLAVQILLGTGMRVGELAALTVEDYESDGDVGFLKVRKGKGAKFRRVPISARLRREVDRYGNRHRVQAETNRLLVRGDGQPVRMVTVGYLLKRIKLRVGFQSPRPQVPPHLRH